MARTYTHTPVLSSQKLGETKYYLKDADARAVLDAINDDAYAALLLGLGTVNGNDGKLVTAANIKSYVDQAVAVGIQIVVPETGVLPTPSAQTMGKLYLIQNAQAAAGTYIEYITLDKGSDVYEWEQIGTTEVDLSNYVQKSTTIAGIDLSDNITKAELQSALELGNMAYVNQGTFTVADYVTGVSSATTTASGTVTLNAFTQTPTAAGLTKGDYTPSGTIDVTLKDASTTTNATITSEAYTPAGTIESFYAIDDSITVPVIDISGFTGGSCDVSYTSEGGVTLAEDANVVVNVSLNAGSLPSLVTTDSSAVFARAGIVAAIASDDSECLVFSDATTSNVMVDLSFNQGTFPTVDESETYGTLETINLSYEAPTLSVSFTKASLGASFYDEFTYEPTSIQPTFEGSQVANMKITNVAYIKQEVDTHTFTGSTAASILVTSVSYDKATQNGATFTGSASDVTVTLSTTSKTVDVNPKTSA